ncbi:hypothetical protein ES708_09197 [subsurface metagenome]
MGGEICHRRGKERGPWYEIKCVRETIIDKEANGKDASFERGLLESWSKYPGWEAARTALDTLGKSKSKRFSAAGNVLHP